MWDDILYTVQITAMHRIMICIVFLTEILIIRVLMNIDEADTAAKTISKWASIGFPYCQIDETDASAKKSELKRCTAIFPDEKGFPSFEFSIIG